MSKKTLVKALQHTVKQQDESLQKRFAVAENLLMSEKPAELQEIAKVPVEMPKRKRGRPRTITADYNGSEPASRPAKTPAKVKVVKSPKAKPIKKLKKIKRPAKQLAELVTRDTFSMPSIDYALIDQLRGKIAKAGNIVNKSELIRAGLRALDAMTPKVLLAHVGKVSKIKPGRKL